MAGEAVSSGPRTTVTYQGIPCLEYSGNRTPGWETDTYSVVIPWPADKPFRVDVHPEGEFGFGGVISGSTAAAHLEPPTAIPPEKGKGIFTRGDLVVETEFEATAPLPKTRMVIENLFVRPDSGARIESFDENLITHTYRLDLVDIRFFLEDRGVIAGDFNIVMSGVGDGSKVYSTTTVAGEGWTFRMFAQLLFLALPGRPTLRSIVPADLADQKISGRSLRLDTAPLDALRGLAAEFGVVPALDYQNGFSFYVLGDGKEGFGVGNQKPIPEALIRRRDTTTSHAYPPEQVWVIGGPTEITIRVTDWEPVGLDDKGRLRNANEAALTLGIAPDRLKRLVLMDEEFQEVYARRAGINADALEQALEWAGLWYRIRGVETINAGLVPMLDRMEIGPDGQRLAPLVEARRYYEVRLRRPEIRSKGPLLIAPEDETIESAAPTTAEARAAARERTVQRQVVEELARAGYVLIDGATPLPETSLGAMALQADGLSPFGFMVQAQPRESVEGEPFRVPLVFIDNALYTFNRQRPGELILVNSTGRGGHRPERRPVVRVRNGSRNIINDVRLDREAGVVRFSRPIGDVRPVGSGNPENDIQRHELLWDDTGLVVTYGLQLKPSLRRASYSGGAMYVQAFELQGVGGGAIGSIIRPARPRPSASPRRVIDGSMILRVALDNSSNIAGLRKQAAQHAINAYRRPGEIRSDDVEVAATLPIEANGFVTAVQWIVDDSARTSYRTGSLAGIRGAPGLARHGVANAFGALGVNKPTSQYEPELASVDSKPGWPRLMGIVSLGNKPGGRP